MKSPMKAIQLLLIGAISTLFPPAAGAGAATGMPSPFFPPYPDLGLCTRCVSKHEASDRYLALTRRHPERHPYPKARVTDNASK